MGTISRSIVDGLVSFVRRVSTFIPNVLKDLHMVSVTGMMSRLSVEDLATFVNRLHRTQLYNINIQNKTERTKEEKYLIHMRTIADLAVMHIIVTTT